MMIISSHRILIICISAIYDFVSDIPLHISVKCSNLAKPLTAFTLSKFYRRFLPVRINEFLPSYRRPTVRGIAPGSQPGDKREYQLTQRELAFSHIKKPQ